MLYDAILLLLLSLLAVYGLVFVIAGLRGLFGSRDAYELNRSVAARPYDTIRGKTRKDESDGNLRVNHGIGFEVAKGDKKNTVILQSKLSTDSVLEVFRQ